VRAPSAVGSTVAALLLALALAGPAAAAPGDPVVGEGIVVTDPAGETEPPEVDEEPEPVSDDVPAPEPDASGKRGELHVLGAETSSSPAPAAAPAAAPADTLPFTGLDAWVLALAGSALLAAGLLVRRATPQASHRRPGPR
jgi:hypothetical protein